MLKVEGWIAEEEVKVLEAEGEGYLQQGKRLVLDLAGVQSIDTAGIQVLQRWTRERLTLKGASPFVQALLEVHGLV
jgi:ABC-type transporter Mla MlaB component